MDKKRCVEKAEIFKVLSDSNRLQIIDMLSCGEMCVCKILEKFNITPVSYTHLDVYKRQMYMHPYRPSFDILSMNPSFPLVVQPIHTSYSIPLAPVSYTHLIREEDCYQQIT